MWGECEAWWQEANRARQYEGRKHGLLLGSWSEGDKRKRAEAERDKRDGTWNQERKHSKATMNMHQVQRVSKRWWKTCIWKQHRRHIKTRHVKRERWCSISVKIENRSEQRSKTCVIDQLGKSKSDLLLRNCSRENERNTQEARAMWNEEWEEQMMAKSQANRKERRIDNVFQSVFHPRQVRHWWLH